MALAFNPSQLKAPTQTVSTSGLTGLLAQQMKGLQNASTALGTMGNTADNLSRDMTTTRLTDLIAKSPTGKLDAQGIRKLVNQNNIDTSRLNKQGTEDFNKLLSGKDAFAKQGTGVIRKDGTFTDLTGTDGVAPEEIRDDNFYAKWKTNNKQFMKALDGKTGNERKTLIDGYLTGDTRSQKTFYKKRDGTKVHDGYIFMYKNEPVTAESLRELLNSKEAVANNPSETPMKREQAQKESDEIANEVTSQIAQDEQAQRVQKLQAEGTKKAYEGALEGLLKQENPNPQAVEQLLARIDPEGTANPVEPQTVVNNNEKGGDALSPQPTHEPEQFNLSNLLKPKEDFAMKGVSEPVIKKTKNKQKYDKSVAINPKTSKPYRNVQNNNLGNIKLKSENNWVGQNNTGSKDKFAHYDTPEQGIRALKIIVNKNVNATNTFEEYVNRYASEQFEKDYYKENGKLMPHLVSYAKIIAKSQGSTDIKSSNKVLDMKKWVKATAEAEGSTESLKYFTDEIIDAGLKMK